MAPRTKKVEEVIEVEPTPKTAKRKLSDAKTKVIVDSMTPAKASKEKSVETPKEVAKANSEPKAIKPKIVKLSDDSIFAMDLMVAHLLERIPIARGASMSSYVASIQKTYGRITMGIYDESEVFTRNKFIDDKVRSLTKEIPNEQTKEHSHRSTVLRKTKRQETDSHPGVSKGKPRVGRKN